MGTGFRTATSGGVAAPPYTNGPYTFSEDITFEGAVTIQGTMVFGDAAVDTLTIGGTATISSDNKFYWRDTGLYVYSSTNGQLDIMADVKMQLTAPTIDLEASTGIVLDGDVSLDAAHTFATGTGAVSLNGDVTVAAGKVLYIRDASQSIASGSDDLMTFTAPTLTLAGATKINLDGPVDVSGAIVCDSSETTGLSMNGTYTGNVIDFSNATIAPTGSNGPCLIRAGTYASPVDLGVDEDQSGMIRLYSTTQAGGTSYDRGIFVCTKTTNTKGVFPISGLAEVNAVATGDGPNKVQAAQFIAHMNSATAKLATLGGDATAGMYGAWLKVASESGSVAASGSRVAAVWVDNQMNGTVSGEEFGIFASCGGSKVDSFIGFNTTSSGWTNFLSFDDTSYDQDPVGTATISGGTQDKYLKVNLNGTAYGLALYAI